MPIKELGRNVFIESAPKRVMPKSGVIIMRRNINWILCILIAGAILFSSCTGMEVKKEYTLEELVEHYWTERIHLNLKEIYQYESPEFREKNDFNQFTKMFGTMSNIEAVSVDGIEMESDKKATAKITYTYTLNLPIPGVYSKKKTRTISDDWVNIDGAWYHYIEIK